MNTLMVILIIILIIILIVVLPLAAMWAINTLFTLTIAYTTLNWFAALVLMLIFGATSHNKY